MGRREKGEVREGRKETVEEGKGRLDGGEWIERERERIRGERSER